MKLTAQQEAFAQSLADGLSQSDAYRKTYKAGKMKPESLWVAASNVARNHKVATRVLELKSALTEKGLWSRQQSVDVLSGIATSGRAGEKVAAVKELNSMHGYNEPAKLDVRVAVSRIELVALK